MNQGNRSGGLRHKAWCDLNKSIEQELTRREKWLLRDAQAIAAGSAQAQCDMPTVCYTLQYAVDVARIERDRLVEDLGVKELTVKDKIKAAPTNACQLADFAKANRVKD